MKLHLLDATYELFRCFFAVPRQRTRDGREVGAVRGLVASLLGLLREPDVTHVAAATDTVIESFRNQLFPGYKTGEGLDPELTSQFSLAEESLEALGIVTWRMREFEADDALATAAHRWAGSFDQVVLLSPDKDLFQCVRDSRVVTHDRRRGLTYDAAAVREKTGVGPESIPDFLALVGDAADGIPGLPGWGPRSAAHLLAAFSCLENIPPDPRQWPPGLRGAERLASTLADRGEDARLYRTLATLRTDVPLPQEAAVDLRWRGLPRESWWALCDSLERPSLREQPPRIGLPWRE